MCTKSLCTIAMFPILACSGCGQFSPDVEIPPEVDVVRKHTGRFDQESNPLRDVEPGSVVDVLNSGLSGCWGTFIGFINLPRALDGGGLIEALVIDWEARTFARQQMIVGELIPLFVTISSGDVELRSSTELVLTTRATHFVGIADLEGDDNLQPQAVEQQFLATLDGDALLLKYPDGADIGERGLYRRFDCP